MFEIKLTLDATPALVESLDNILRVLMETRRMAELGKHCGPLTHRACPAELREMLEKDGTAEKAPNLPSEDHIEPEQAETPQSAEEPKKRKHSAKKRPSESNTPVAPAEEAPAPAPEPAPEIVTPAPVEETTAQEQAPFVEATAAQAEDPLAGKGQTGEILAELTRKALGDLDALGVDRGDANRRIRDYCARNEIKFPTFPAVLQAVGYAEAIAICKGA